MEGQINKRLKRDKDVLMRKNVSYKLHEFQIPGHLREKSTTRKHIQSVYRSIVLTVRMRTRKTRIDKLVCNDCN